MYVPPCFSTNEFTMKRFASPTSPNTVFVPMAATSAAMISCTNIKPPLNQQQARFSRLDATDDTAASRSTFGVPCASLNAISTYMLTASLARDVDGHGYSRRARVHEAPGRSSGWAALTRTTPVAIG